MNPVKCLLAIWLGLAAGLATKEIGESVFCRICQSTQNSLLGFSEKHLQLGLQLASLLCQTESTKDLCDYFVDNFGASIFHNKVKFLQTTQHICANLLKLCQETYQPFDVEAFRRKINSEFPVPVNLLGSNRQNRKKSAAKSFKALVLNDIHIQNDYSHGAPTDCGQPGGCCSNRFQPKPGSDRRAGYWGTADAACDAPDYLFFKTVEFIKNSTDKPDFIFMLGDNTGHNFFELEPQILVDSTKIIIDTLKQTFPDIPTIPVLGNHECHHVDYFFG